MSLIFSLNTVLAPNMDVLASSPNNVACPYCEGVSNRYSPGIRVSDILYPLYTRKSQINSLRIIVSGIRDTVLDIYDSLVAGCTIWDNNELLPNRKTVVP